MKGVFTAGDHCGQLGFSVTGQVGQPLWNMPHSYLNQGARKLGCSSADSHLSLWSTVSGGTCWYCRPALYVGECAFPARNTALRQS